MKEKRIRRCTTTEKDFFAFHASNGEHGNDLDIVRAWIRRNVKKGISQAMTLRNFIIADQEKFEKKN